MVIDSVIADAIDEVSPDCELVDRPGGAGRPSSDSELVLMPALGPKACQIDRLGTAGNDVIAGGAGGDNIFWPGR